MMNSLVVKIFLPCMIALTACSAVDNQSRQKPATNLEVVNTADVNTNKESAKRPADTIKDLPGKYIKAFTCDFDENPITAARRYHGTPAGRAERAHDLTLLKSLGFEREGRDGDLESVGGKIAAPPGLTILGLPVRFLEINGMIGDANSMYATTFDRGVTVDQVVQAARLEMDRESYDKYKIRHYSKRVGGNPYTDVYLDDRGSGNALLVCQVQSTPD
jgi:hypothetical protein